MLFVFNIVYEIVLESLFKLYEQRGRLLIRFKLKIFGRLRFPTNTTPPALHIPTSRPTHAAYIRQLKPVHRQEVALDHDEDFIVDYAH